MMTETDWLTSTTPLALVNYIQAGGMSSQRKCRLICAAFWWFRTTKQKKKTLRSFRDEAVERVLGKPLKHHIPTPFSLEYLTNIDTMIVYFAERMADGEPPHPHHPRLQYFASDLDNEYAPLMTDALLALKNLCIIGMDDKLDDRTALCHIIGDVLGNPFRPVAIGITPNCWRCNEPMRYMDTPEYEFGQWGCDDCGMADQSTRGYTTAYRSGRLLDQAILLYGNPTIREAAQSIYLRRAWDETPMLADMLEEAGGYIEELIMSLRGMELTPGLDWQPKCRPTVTGDWAVDLLAGRS